MGVIAMKAAGTNERSLVAAARDRASFASLAEGYRRELLVHCYRMLASFNDAEDLVQETLLRAWKNRASFEGRSSFRAWLYRIATNACLDFLGRHERRVLVHESSAGPTFEVPWLQPIPDRLLDHPAPSEQQPDALAVTKESIELAWLVALQVLSPRQRAAVILCDVLDWSAREAAELLDSSVASVNGSLRRARAILARRQSHAAARKTGDAADEQERNLLRLVVDATERGDVAGLAALLRDDVKFAMPPEPEVYAGRDAVVQCWVDGGFGSAESGTWRCLLTRANRMPAVACYLREPGAPDFRAMALDVLSIQDGAMSEITTFSLKPLCPLFDLPESLPAMRALP